VTEDEAPFGVTGLSDAEAQLALARFGPNALVSRERLLWLRETIEVLADPMALMLAATATVYLWLGDTTDGVIMLAALVPVLGVDVVLEARARGALKQLSAAVAPQARVVRGGRVTTIPTRDIVPGDVLLLREGDFILADGVVHTAANLALDESQLTGESEPRVKRSTQEDDAPADARFFAGSRVVAGHGHGVVTATGLSTRFGDLAQLVAAANVTQSPLQRRTAWLVRRLAVAAVLVAALVLALGLLRHQPWTTALIAAISLAMAAIPEEFPLVFTLFLSVGAFRLGQRGVLVRRLAAVETLGSTTVICTDKTGTLTEGGFALDRVVALDGGEERTLLELAVLACERSPVDPMERAIAARAAAAGVDAVAITARGTLLRDHDFDPVGKHMSHVWAHEGGARVVAKGALEGILDHCAADDPTRRRAEEANENLAAEGMRVLALAVRDGADAAGNRATDERDLRLVALLGFRDPLRPEVPRAVAECQRAGIRVKMVTGDHLLTAHAIADAAGIVHEHGHLLTGETLDALPETERAESIARAAVFARISPAQKFAIVEALRTRGEIVAMTGDGINDAPALRRADIGISMGRGATDVARATADLVLMRNDFAAIVDAIREGRRIFSEIQAAFLYLLAFHVPIVALALLAPLLALPLVLLPIHLVWLELVVHPVSALVFQGDKPPADLMMRPPRSPDAPLLMRSSVVRSLAAGALLAIAVLAVFAWTLPTGEWPARGLALAVLIVGDSLLVWLERGALRVPGDFLSRRPRSWLVWAISLASLPVVMAVPALARVFRVAPLGPSGWVIATSVAAVAVGWRLAADRMAFRLVAY
jgi:Ca2+-transporting ATPase